MRRQPIAPIMPDDEKPSPGATLTVDQINEKLEKGEIKPNELPMQTRDSYRDFVRNYKRARFNGDI